MLPPQNPGILQQPHVIGPVWKCPNCPLTNTFHGNAVDGYFTNAALICDTCKTTYTTWDVVSAMIREPVFFNGFSALGALTMIFRTKLFWNSETRIDLHEHGVPKNAFILNMSFASYNGLFCFEMTGNSRRRRPRGAKVQLMGFKTYTVRDNFATESIVDIHVTWVVSSEADFAWNNLVAAFDAYADDDYLEAIIPANVAIENRLHRLVYRDFEGTCSKDRIESFLKDATYSHQLNVLLPYILSLKALPPMDDKLRGHLNGLRKLRNEIAHNGYREKPLTRSECADYLAAVVFGFRYLDIISKTMGSGGEKAAAGTSPS